MTDEERKRAQAILTNIEQTAGEIGLRDRHTEAQIRAIRENAGALRKLLRLDSDSS